MIALDKTILEFVSNNWLSLYILITLLKGIAILTPSNKDDSIVKLISQIYNALKSGLAPDKLDCEDKADRKVQEARDDREVVEDRADRKVQEAREEQ